MPGPGNLVELHAQCERACGIGNRHFRTMRTRGLGSGAPGGAGGAAESLQTLKRKYGATFWWKVITFGDEVKQKLQHGIARWRSWRDQCGAGKPWAAEF